MVLKFLEPIFQHTNEVGGDISGQADANAVAGCCPEEFHPRSVAHAADCCFKEIVELAWY